MKTNISYLLLSTFVFGVVACSDENDGPFLNDGDNITGKNSIGLIAPESGGSYILSEADANKTWEVFSWKNANETYVGPMEYYIEVSVEGNELSPVLIGPYTTQPVVITEGNLNKALVTLGYTDANTQLNVFTRVKQVVGKELTNLEYYSSLVSSSVIGYGGSTEEPGIPTMYLPGGYQGDPSWTPDNTYQIYSMNDDGIYTGYMNFINATDEFKITVQKNWDNNYGGTSANNAGTLASGGDNLVFNGNVGTYLLTVNLNDMTWGLEATNWQATVNTWGLIGNATPGGWDADTDMVYNQQNGLLELTVELLDGEIKFRANDGWDLNYGDTGTDGVADNGGDNIVVTAGKYYIALDFRNPAQVTYVLEAR